MAGENENGGVLELTQQELDDRIAEAARTAAETATAELQASHTSEMQELRGELATERAERRQAVVRDTARDLESAGHAPAVVVRAAEIMLADNGDTVLELSQEGSDDPRRLTATDIVLSILEAVPDDQLNLARTQGSIGGGSRKPAEDEDTRTVDEKAEELLNELREKAVTVTVPT